MTTLQNSLDLGQSVNTKLLNFTKYSPRGWTRGFRLMRKTREFINQEKDFNSVNNSIVSRKLHYYGTSKNLDFF